MSNTFLITQSGFLSFNMKTCSKCFVDKETSFYPKDKNRKDGYLSWCKDCNNKRYRKYYQENSDAISVYTSRWNKKNRQKITESQRQKRKINPDKYRDLEYRRKYNLSLDEYNHLFQSQNGKCKICCTPHKILYVDHCHNTGKVRGLLCNSCNKALGLLKDNIMSLKNAILYLEKS